MTEESMFNSRLGQEICLVSIQPRLPLDSIRLPIQWVQASVTHGDKAGRRHESDLPHVCPRLRMVALYLHSPIHVHMVGCLTNETLGK
jgi:hypothetical protein